MSIRKLVRLEFKFYFVKLVLSSFDRFTLSLNIRSYLGETAQASGETSNAPETPANPAIDKTAASEMSVEPSTLTPPSDRPLEMHVEASNVTPPTQTDDVPQSDTPQEPTPNVQTGNSEMQVEASGVAASDTPDLAPRPPQVADVISVPEAGLFVTPNPDTPIQVCPGAPTRVLLETPDDSDPNLAPTPSSPDDDDLMDTTGNGPSPSGKHDQAVLSLPFIT